MMTATVYYTVTYGPGEGSDVMDYEVELTPEEAAAYKKAQAEGTLLEDMEELEDALSRAYKEIEEIEIANACAMYDGFAIRCRDQGISPFGNGYSLSVNWPDSEDDEWGEDEYAFTIHITTPNGEGDIEIDFPVTDEELDLIEEAIDNGESFEDVEELSDLYERVMEAVPDKLEEDLQENNDAEIDPDDLEYTLDFE